MSQTTTIKVGESAKTITLPEGKALILTGSGGAVGVAYLLDPALGGTNSLRSWAVGAGALAAIGPYENSQKIHLTCSAGSIAAVVKEAVLTISATPTPTAPGQPAKPVLTAMAGAVSLAWTPGAAGSTATTGNVWTDINGQTTVLTTNPQVITAPAGTPYTGTVKTQNAQGFGPPSVQADSVTPTPSAITEPLDFPIVIEGDSIGAGTGTTSSSLAQALIIALNGRMSMPLGFNQAVSGENTVQTSSTTETSAVNALLPKIVFDHTATNDIRLGSQTVAQIIQNKNTQYAAYTSVDHIFVGPMLPCNDTAWQALSQSRKDDMTALNTAIAAMANDRIHVVPIPSGFSIAQHCLPDQIHLNDAGAKLYAETIASTMAPYIASGDIRPRYLDSSNVLLAAGNPQLTGTAGTKTGGITGEVGDGWTAAGSFDGTMACVASKVTDFNGAIGQRFTISGAAATAGRSFSLNRTVTISGQIGEQYEGWIDWQLAAGHQGVRNPGLLVAISGEVGADTAGRVNAVTRTSGLATAGTLRTTYSGVLTAARTSLTFNFVTTFDVGATVAEVTVGRPCARKRPA